MLSFLWRKKDIDCATAFRMPGCQEDPSIVLLMNDGSQALKPATCNSMQPVPLTPLPKNPLLW